MISSDRVVRKPLKIDLHIHSAASRHKDGKKVKNGTVENIGVLFGKLEKNKVNMAAITDHDVFDYDMYAALHEKVEDAAFLQHVLPGVEFTVSFKGDEGYKPVHVITLFDDSDPDAVKKIGDAIPSKDGRPIYDRGNAFSEERYWKIIRSIGLNIVTIAHQKTSPSSERKSADDANSVGEERFNEFLFLDYFEAYEYRNRKNELFNKLYSYTTDQYERMRFITGSDCHVWSAYPEVEKEIDSSKSSFVYTYLKCLPTFRGLAMAATDVSRIKTVPSFFSGSTDTIDAIELALDGVGVDIPLSPGINALIGDNSIGKSSLLNALNGFREIRPAVKRGQLKYLKSSGLELRRTFPQGSVLQFDGQDAVRKTFEDLSEGKTKKQLERHFPGPVNASPFKTLAMNEFRKYAKALKSSCEYQDALSELVTYTIPNKPALATPESITFYVDVNLEDPTPHSGMTSELHNVILQIGAIVESYEETLVEEDKVDFEIATSALNRIHNRHQLTVERINRDARVANKVVEAATVCEKDQSERITDAQKAQTAYSHAIERIGSCLAKAVKCEQGLTDFAFEFAPIQIDPNVNPVDDLQFICKLGVDAITPALLNEVVNGLIGKRKSIDTLTSSFESVKDAINDYPQDEDDPIKVLEEKFIVALDEKLKPAKAINREGDDVFDELSRGYDAQMYFKLMADRNAGEGLYIVDQPEDQISQKAIRKAVLREFRDIANARQVILITHNPQFIVNLDVDNVIFLGKDKDKLFIRSGALEYECGEYSILKTVADNIEGGLETIQRRMKRYEKAN